MIRKLKIILKNLYCRALRYESEIVQIKICDKINIRNTVPILIKEGNKLKYIIPYRIYFLYKEKRCFIDNEELYKKYKMGEEIAILVYKGYNKKGIIKDEYFDAV